MISQDIGEGVLVLASCGSYFKLALPFIRISKRVGKEGKLSNERILLVFRSKLILRLVVISSCII
ncbi:hypothetical protein RchiOBHm_Chr3g0487951 [Rosa chinensis]|uniref:Uncharacterized protein n=1 Tax=Rosa chinensis TaxID=74649 RepID=A0A2P6RFM4_ROSCH|nr:hypothetical protein RchiOBHm_Chr3g0487951 [Rosa chinensis]